MNKILYINNLHLRFSLGFHHVFLLIFLFFLFSFIPSAHTADVVYFGKTSGAEVSDWRTDTTLKTMDIDGDNQYGSTLGAVQWEVGSVGETGAGVYGWSSNNGNLFFPHLVGVQVDDILNYPTKVDAGIMRFFFTFTFNGVADDYLNKIVRVGIMHDLLDAPYQAGDSFMGFRIVQDIGGTGDSGIIQLRNGAAGSGIPEMYFFDITGINPGDRFTIHATNNIGGLSGNEGFRYLGPVSWDIADIEPIPEPSTYALMALGGIVALVYARNRRRAIKA